MKITDRQCQDRVHKLGNKQVDVVVFDTDNSLDEYIRRQKEKPLWPDTRVTDDT